MDLTSFKILAWKKAKVATAHLCFDRKLDELGSCVERRSILALYVGAFSPIWQLRGSATAMVKRFM